MHWEVIGLLSVTLIRDTIYITSSFKKGKKSNEWLIMVVVQ